MLIVQNLAIMDTKHMAHRKHRVIYTGKFVVHGVFMYKR